ncbi:class I SAM-dependent methyltransferase [Brachyspira hyodysenteriae]|uniref:class I SAM-dependent methyltransferase n=1 Tax=Brachyspira hyodysenteriae TaxID=159 RepID=UPI001ADD89A1|nr:class I SAM-dependent methyltransferase [Brachyspira hyodysenteriae]MBT8721093.1 class I SAM-dependent methyltransferase [Brachyspira hyodysenteriae]MBT8731351.1 class I SAM-dependent methyltransferase [Brachyspira hyodysenteriae]MBT8733938.1 class I SAM-dependent methyltransferase [Brachyspira hyodysenteriae]MBT8736506.1 class I SAM-dependent methyltransferase [Brachyspira hyodysenteriae]MBT8739079.1 class I SAM-dependent methyltransferase [Brachyspira hyodysenteriae]
MPKNIIDKLAWFIPIKSLRNKFKINMKKHIINNYKYIKKTANSEIVNKYLTGLKGIEIGGASYADYGIDAINIDRVNISLDSNNAYYLEQNKHSSFIQDIDIISNGDELPFKDSTVDFVFTSHVLEHFFDPIKALKEWYRVTKKDGYIFMIIPHKERTFDKDRERTTLNELIRRHDGTIKSKNQYDDMHHSVWITEDILELCKYLNFNVVEYHDMDDCRKDGFIIVIQK